MNAAMTIPGDVFEQYFTGRSSWIHLSDSHAVKTKMPEWNQDADSLEVLLLILEIMTPDDEYCDRKHDTDEVVLV